MKPEKKKRVFSRQEADALIPELERRLKDLRSKKEAYSRTHDALFMRELVCAAEHSNGYSGGEDDLEDGIHALEEAIEGLAKDVEAIFALGVVLRDIEKGQVEFFGVLEGRNVFFFWEMGEPVIGHYRSLNSRFHERVKLSRA